MTKCNTIHSGVIVLSPLIAQPVSFIILHTIPFVLPYEILPCLYSLLLQSKPSSWTTKLWTPYARLSSVLTAWGAVNRHGGRKGEGP